MMELCEESVTVIEVLMTIKNDGLTKALPARIYILYSKQSNSAVILRKGPNKLTLSIGWNLQDDSFQKGQWLLGKIYYEYCAISHDGKYWFYSAYKKAEYSVIAKVPYFKAIYYLYDMDRWREGSYFDSEKIKKDRDHNGYFFDPEYLRIVVRVREFFEEGAYIFESHMMRKNWKEIDQFAYDNTARFSLKFASDWQLSLLGVKYGHRREDGGEMPHIYELKHLPTQKKIDTDRWEWADYDAFNERIIWAEMGLIMTAKLHISENEMPALRDIKCLLDTNDMQFEELIAPY